MINLRIHGTLHSVEATGDTPLLWVLRDLTGQIMAAAALLKSTALAGDADIEAAMAGNICRCGTYVRIRAAIKQAAAPS
jgi:hypothetical protein